MNRALILAGLALLLAGLFWPWLRQLPLGRLPGDVHIDRGGFQFFFPLTTCLVLSVLLSLLFRWLKK